MTRTDEAAEGRAVPPRYLPGMGVRARGVATPEPWRMPALPSPWPAFLFPRLLDRAVARAAADPRAAFLPTDLAFRHLGRDLVRYVDPDAIDVQLSQRVLCDGRLLRLSRRFLDAGDWEAVTLPFKSSFIRRAMDELVAHGDSFSGMTAYRDLIRRARKGKPHDYNGVLLDTPARVEAYFRRYLTLIENVRAQGLRPYCAFDKASFVRNADIRRARMERTENEIGLAIGPDGRFYRFLSGRHRTAIAQALRLPLMPVRVRIVHARWLAGLARDTGLPPHAALRDWLGRQPAWDAEVPLSQLSIPPVTA